MSSIYYPMVDISTHCDALSGWYLHEIYPQSETPQLVQIANIDIDYRPGVYHSRRQYLSPDKVICHIFHDSKTILRVWDYRLNASVSFMTPVDVKDANFSEVIHFPSLGQQCRVYIIYRCALFRRLSSFYI